MNGKPVLINRHGRLKTVSGKILRIKSCLGFQIHQKANFFALVITNVDHLMVDHGEFGLVRLWNTGGEQKH